jgi:effector-binding domain-containing protein
MPSKSTTIKARDLMAVSYAKGDTSYVAAAAIKRYVSELDLSVAGNPRARYFKNPLGTA